MKICKLIAKESLEMKVVWKISKQQTNNTFYSLSYKKQIAEYES